MTMNAIYLGANTIGANRSVEASHRAAMNGLASLATSIGRGLGPVAAGFLVAFSLTAGVIPASLGGWFAYVFMTAMGF